MAYYCQACGKEMDREEEFCAECKASMSILDGAPAQQPAAPSVVVATTTVSNDAKKGNGPAIAAMILSIIGFFTTVIMCAIFSTAVKTPGFMSELNSIMKEMMYDMYGANLPNDMLALSVSLAFGIYYFSGWLFMLLGLIFGLIAVVKYAKNTCPVKSKAVLIMGIIGLVLVAVSFIIALSCYINTSNIVNAYYGIM